MGYAILRIAGGRKPVAEALGVITLSRFENHYLRLRRIYERVQGLVEQYLPDEMAIEAPFFGKNVQSMLKLGRAQGVAMAAALTRDVPITEYEPRKIKQAITGNGAASKEQLRGMLMRILNLGHDQIDPLPLDATDALGAALCHFYESSRPANRTPGSARNWAEFISRNPGRISEPTRQGNRK